MSTLDALHQAAVHASRTFAENKKKLGDLRPSFWAALTDFEFATDGSEGRDAVIAAFKQAYPKLGAPGDFGYGTPCGDALKELYDRYGKFVEPTPESAAT